MEGKNKNKMWIILGSSFAVLLITCLVGLIFTGMYVGWGPFAFMQFDHEEKVILQKYDFETRKGEIVFYGASNFRLWTEMENDLSEYKVQNHGFGGSTDKDLVERAERFSIRTRPPSCSFRRDPTTMSLWMARTRKKWKCAWSIKGSCSRAFMKGCPMQSSSS